MDDTLLQLGVGGIFAILMIREALNWAKPLIDKVRGQESSRGKDDDRSLDQLIRDLASVLSTVLELSRKVDEIHSWHNVRNSDGGFVWYTSPSLELTLQQLARNIEQQTELMRMLAEVSRDNQKTLERMERKLNGHT